MRKLALLVMVLVGCESSPVEPEPVQPEPTPTVNPVGAYTLAALDGKPLPADMAQPGGDCRSSGQFCVSKGALTIAQGGSYTLTFEWTRYYTGGTVDQTGRRDDTGTWVVADSTVTFTSAVRTTSTGAALRFNGRGRASEVLVTDGNAFTFRK